ncbi:hypothetical protein LB503_010439 [Fusarium chuoi]|nr:hypothetical protein LB503_010439 [Fusarium chuoi]
MQVAASASIIGSDDLLKSSYGWNKLGVATVVGTGGYSGHDSTTIAWAFPNLKFMSKTLLNFGPLSMSRYLPTSSPGSNLSRAISCKPKTSNGTFI